MTLGKPLDRILFFAGGLMMIHPELKTDMIGLGLIAVGLALQLIMKRKTEARI